jgi:PAS domain S-box-containing protein
MKSWKTGSKNWKKISVAHQKIEEESRLQIEIITNMAEGVYLVRLKDATIIYTNPKFEKMFGYDPGEMIGRHVSIVNAPTDKTPEKMAE